MSVSMSQISTPVFLRMLRNLKGLLEKAQAHAQTAEIKPEVLVAARLYPNMLPLSSQVQIACDTAKRAVARLSGIAAPSQADTETTLEQLLARIDTTVAFIKTVPAAEIDGTQDKAITVELPMGNLNFTGLNYLTSFALPNFFFHVSTAHAILRHNGVPIGKMDYMGAP